jgi:hypothetical protein
MKNLMAAYSRRGPPQMPMRKYMGSSMNSKNRKNRKKSSATKQPTTLVLSSRYSAA